MRYGLWPRLAVLVVSFATLLSSDSTAEELNQRTRFSTSKRQKISRIVDCVRQGETLQGTLRDRNGKAVQRTVLHLENARGELKLTHTDPAGKFVFQDVSNGVYALRVSPRTATKVRRTLREENAFQDAQWIRVWDKQTAPPAASERLLAVLDGAVLRGQCCANAGVMSTCDQCGDCADCCDGCGPAPCFGAGRLVQAALDNPWMVAAGTAAAIAIPIAANDDDVRAGDDTDAVGGSGEAPDAS